MQEEDYTFVTLDSDDAILTDAVIVDVDGENDLSDVVMIDESIDVSDLLHYPMTLLCCPTQICWIHIQPILTDLIYRSFYDFR